MLVALLIIVLVLWLLGYVNFSPLMLRNYSLFSINNRVISLYELLMFLVLLWIIGVLPSPLREIGSVLLVLWVLSVLGILAFGGLSNLIILAVIIGLIAAMLGFGRRYV